MDYGILEMGTDNYEHACRLLGTCGAKAIF